MIAPDLITVGHKTKRLISKQGKPPKLKGKVVALDTETTGLQGWKGARIFMVSYATEKGEKGYLYATKAVIEWFINILKDPNMTVIFQNGKFDFKMLAYEGLSVWDIKCELHDTLIMSVLLHELGKHNLAALVRRYLKKPADEKSAVDEWISAHKKKNGEWVKKHGRQPNFSDAPPKIVQKRAIWDVVHTLKLYYLFKKPIRKDFWDLYRQEVELFLCTVEMEDRGVLVDLDRIAKLKKQAKSDLKWLEKKMRKIVGRDFVIKGTGSKKDFYQVITEDFGWKIKSRTEKGNPQFDEFAMLKYLDESLHQYVRANSEETPTREYIKGLLSELRKKKLPKKQSFGPMITKWRELDKMVGTYYENFEEMAIPIKSKRNVGVIHCKFNSTAAITGRFSSSEPNLQNVPRVLGPRECFTTRRGYVNYHFDYSQIEIRLFVHYAQDEELREALLNGADMHMLTALAIHHKKDPKNVTKEQRKVAKTVNFGIIYGAGAKTLAHSLTVKTGIPHTRAMAKSFLDAYHSQYPSVRRIMGKLKAEILRRGFVQNEFGRRHRVPVKANYKALNALIQGCAADIMKRAMLRVWHFLHEHGCRSRLIMTIHDEIVLEIWHEEEAWLVPKVKELMEMDSPKFFLPVPTDIEKTATYWSEKKDVAA